MIQNMKRGKLLMKSKNRAYLKQLIKKTHENEIKYNRICAVEKKREK